MNVTFFDDPLSQEPEDVRIRKVGFYVYEDKRRVAVGFNLTPFRERPSVEATIVNERGELAGSLNVIEVLRPNFSLTMHLRDKEPTATYMARVVVYYATPETQRQDVDELRATFAINKRGDQIFEAQ